MIENPDIRGLIQRFKEFILERDLTLQEAALWLKVSHSTIARLLNENVSKPHERTIYKIKKFLGE